MSEVNVQQTYSASPAVVYPALIRAIVGADGEIEKEYRPVYSIRFTTLTFRGGGRYVARILPWDEGALIRIDGSSRSSSPKARLAEQNGLVRILKAVSDLL